VGEEPTQNTGATTDLDGTELHADGLLCWLRTQGHTILHASYFSFQTELSPNNKGACGRRIRECRAHAQEAAGCWRTGGRPAPDSQGHSLPFLPQRVSLQPPSHGVKAAPLALLTLRWVSRHLPELGHVDIYCPWDDTAPVRSPQRELS
jgi:hypothetical protein